MYEYGPQHVPTMADMIERVLHGITVYEASNAGDLTWYNGILKWGTI